MWSVKSIDSLAGHGDHRGFHAIPTFDTTLSGFSNIPKHGNQQMN